MTFRNFDKIEALADQNLNRTNRVFSHLGMEIHTQFMRASGDISSKCLIIRFHGAIQRDKRPLPSFQANLKQNQPFANQLTICDPTMMTRTGFSLGWFAGHESLPVQELLSDFFVEVMKVLKPTKVIFLGSSGGGFASLYYSFQFPRSVSLVMAPQTNIANHITPAVNSYLANCWSDRSLQDVSSEITTDLCELYSKGHENLVVYLQSAGDYLHNRRHLAPFVKSVHEGSPEDHQKFILISSFWGKHGHGGAIPHEAYLPWLKAIASSPDLTCEKLLDTQFIATSRTDVLSAKPSEISAQGVGAFDDLEIATANLLRDLELKS